MRHNTPKIDSLGKVAVLGWYGDFNVGNDALLLGILYNLAAASSNDDTIVFSWHPKLTAKLYGVHAAFYHKVFTVIPRINTLVVGGGTLLTDWKLALFLFIFLSLTILWAKKLGKKILLYGIGVERFTTKIGRLLARKIASAADIIVVRGYESAKELKRLGHNGKVFVSEDLAFTLPSPNEKDQDEILRNVFKTKRPLAKGDLKVIICPKRCLGMSKIKKTLVEIADRLIEEHNAKVIFLPMSTSLYDDDRRAIEEIVRLSKRRGEIILLKGRYTPMEVMALIGWSDLVISMRLHPLIFSVKMGKPAIALIGASTLATPPSTSKIYEAIECINQRNAQENNDKICICNMNIDSSQLMDKIRQLFLQKTQASQPASHSK